MKLPPVSQNLDRAAAWTWRLLVCAAALAGVLALMAVALTGMMLYFLSSYEERMSVFLGGG